MLVKLKKVWKNRKGYIAYTRKAIINVTGLVGSLLALGLLPDKYSAPAAAVVAVLTVVVHYKTGNADSPVPEETPPAV